MTAHYKNHSIFCITLLFGLLMGCDKRPPPEISAIAHSGGGINGMKYTNSIEALNHNYERGFELFEIDFSWTLDNQVVCLHDWGKTAAWLLNYAEKEPLNMDQFKALKNDKLNLTPCDLFSLNKWLTEHPKSFIITDFKGRNNEGLAMMLETIIDAKHRIIPQFTQPEHYETIKDMGFKHLIWTLFSYQGSNEDLIKHSSQMNLFAITMPPNRAKTSVSKNLHNIGIPTYVHTINSQTEALDYQEKYGLTSVYTDFLEKNFDEINK